MHISEGKELVSGKTNENGDFSFKIPVVADLKIVTERGQGAGCYRNYRREMSFRGLSLWLAKPSQPDFRY